jgi:hypothetical protein
VVGLAALGALVYWLIRRKREGKPRLLDPSLFASKLFSFGIFQGILQQIALGGLLIALPIYLQLVLGYNALQAGLTLAPLSLTMFGVALLAGKRAGRRRPASLIRAGFVLLGVSILILIPIVPSTDTGWYFAIPLVLAGTGLGLLVSQLNAYTLSPISEERVGEAAGVNSATGSFGLSFGLAFAGAIMLATLSIAFTDKAESSPVLPPGGDAAGGGRPGGRRGGDERCPARGTARRPAQGDPGGDPQHQRGRAIARPSGRAGPSAPRRHHRPVQLVPHDATAGSETGERRHTVMTILPRAWRCSR